MDHSLTISSEHRWTLGYYSRWPKGSLAVICYIFEKNNTVSKIQEYTLYYNLGGSKVDVVLVDFNNRA